MIPRYSRPEMVAIWSPERKFRIWYEIEAHACDAQAELGVIPKDAAEAVWKAKDATFDVARIDEIEAVTKHDVIAFLTHLGEIIGPSEARFVHQGMTSSDVLDTCFNVQLTEAADILIAAEGEMAHLVPASALTLNDEGVLGVRAVAQDDMVAFHPVTVLRDTIDGMWLTGLPEQADIIVRGQEFVTEGVQVAATLQEHKS